MKYITERTEIAKFFREHKIIKINMDVHADGYDTLFEGEKVEVAVKSSCGKSNMYVLGKLMYCSDIKKFYVSSGGTMLTNSFGYSDVMELYERNHAPTVAEGDIVGILEDYKNQSQCRIRVMKVKDCNIMYYEACVFEDVE
jgi:hypothetical protein